MTQNDGSYPMNCAETVLVNVTTDLSIASFNEPCRRVACVLGGGIAGCGEVCGAITGGVMCIGLSLGACGTEPLDEYKQNRKRARGVARDLMWDFTRAWGSVRCSDLRGMDKGEMPPKGRLRLDDEGVKNRCQEYIDWTSDYVIRVLK